MGTLTRNGIISIFQEQLSRGILKSVLKVLVDYQKSIRDEIHLQQKRACKVTK